MRPPTRHRRQRTAPGQGEPHTARHAPQQVLRRQLPSLCATTGGPAANCHCGRMLVLRGLTRRQHGSGQTGIKCRRFLQQRAPLTTLRGSGGAGGIAPLRSRRRDAILALHAEVRRVEAEGVDAHVEVVQSRHKAGHHGQAYHHQCHGAACHCRPARYARHAVQGLCIGGRHLVRRDLLFQLRRQRDQDCRAVVTDDLGMRRRRSRRGRRRSRRPATNLPVIVDLKLWRCGICVRPKHHHAALATAAPPRRRRWWRAIAGTHSRWRTVAGTWRTVAGTQCFCHGSATHSAAAERFINCERLLLQILEYQELQYCNTRSSRTYVY
jgi:hypothetical protein